MEKRILVEIVLGVFLWLQCENTPLNYAAYKYAETSGYVDNIYKALDNDLETYAKIQHFQLKGFFRIFLSHPYRIRIITVKTRPFADDIDLYLKNHINGTGFYVGGIPSSGEGEFKINTTKLYEIVELKGNFLEIVIYEISVEAFYRKIDVAYNKIAKQSNPSQRSSPMQAIDGDSLTYAIVPFASRVWWRVNLLALYFIEGIFINLYTIGLKNRKSLVRILLKQYAMGQGLPCANFLNKASRNFSCHILKTYRFVEITTSSSEMYISDVHVYAVGEPLEPKTSLTDTSFVRVALSVISFSLAFVVGILFFRVFQKHNKKSYVPKENSDAP